MSCLFEFKGNDIIYALNFDLKDDFETKIRVRKDCVYGLYKEGERYFVPFGVNKDGSFGCFLPLVGSAGEVSSSYNALDLCSLVEDYIYGKYEFNQINELCMQRNVVNPINKSFHTILFDNYGRSLFIEPNKGIKQLEEKYNVLTGFSYFNPLNTKNLDNSGYHTYEAICSVLNKCQNDFSAIDAFSILKQLKNDGEYPLRISFVYSVKAKCAYWCLNGDFNDIHKNQF